MAVGLFIDGGYAFRMVNHLSTLARLDYLKLRRTVEAISFDRIDDAHYFDSVDEESIITKAGFHHFLGKSVDENGAGIEVHLYGLKTRYLKWPRRMGVMKEMRVLHPVSGLPFVLKTQRAVDVSLGFHLISSFINSSWDKLYLVAGDSDYVEVIEHLVNVEQVEVTIIGSQDSISPDLQQYAKRTMTVEEYWSSLTSEQKIGPNFMNDSSILASEEDLPNFSPEVRKYLEQEEGHDLPLEPTQEELRVVLESIHDKMASNASVSADNPDLLEQAEEETNNLLGYNDDNDDDQKTDLDDD